MSMPTTTSFMFMRSFAEWKEHAWELLESFLKKAFLDPACI
jgi:hypothetical protein